MVLLKSDENGERCCDKINFINMPIPCQANFAKLEGVETT